MVIPKLIPVLSSEHLEMRGPQTEDFQTYRDFFC